MQGVRKILETEAREVRECCKQSLVDDPGIILGGRNASGNVDSKDYAHEVSEGRRTLLGTGLEAPCVNPGKELV